MEIVQHPIPLRTDADGIVRVGGTRVPLDTVVLAYEAGATAEDIAEDYSALALADVHAALAYYLLHRAEVAAYLARRQEQARQVRRENEARFPSSGVRARLRARRSGRP